MSRSDSSTRRRSTAALTLLLVLVGATPLWAAEPAGGATRSVSLLPAEPSPDDPNNGTWFVLQMEAGSSGGATAAVTNPTDQTKRVRLYLRALEFDDAGTPTLGGNPNAGLGAWGRFDRSPIEVPPRSTIRAPFKLTVPPGTPAGDHVGAAVAETSDDVDGTTVVQRVATRVVVTVPGEAERGFVIEDVDIEPNSTWWPSSVVARVRVRNTGAIRVDPTVTVAGIDASGARTLLARSTEEYVADIDLSTLGGVLTLPIEAIDGSGITRRLDRGVTVVPWGLLLLAVVVIGVAVLSVRAFRRSDRVAALQADVKRLERLVSRLESGMRHDMRAPVEGSVRDTVEDALRAALRGARRSDELEAFGRTALALHETAGDALDELLEALSLGAPQRDALVAAISDYDPAEVEAHALAEELPAEVFAMLLERTHARA